ncbi:hypothetical protein SK128_016468, partial [Halocaridina rubra]
MATRRPFSAQSTLYVLLDYTDAEKVKDLELIRKALEDTIVVGGGVVGAIRLPGLGMGLLGPPFQRLLKLSAIRNNIPSVLTALNFMYEGLQPAQEGTEFVQDVCSALDTILAEAESFSLALSHPLQLLVITWRPLELLTKTVTSALTHLHAKFIRAVHVVRIVSLLNDDTEDEDLPVGDAAGGVWITGAPYTADPYSLAALFKSWLCETKGSDPHLLLTLQATGEEDVPLTCRSSKNFTVGLLYQPIVNIRVSF